jgi:hypothetical protein
MNKNMAIIQKQTLTENQTPKITIAFPSSSEDKLHIGIAMENLNPHKVRVKVDLNLNYRDEKIPISEGFYNGSKQWFLNPMEFFQGHWDFKDDLKAQGKEFGIISKNEKDLLLDRNSKKTDKWRILFFAPKVQLTSESGISYELWPRVYYYDFEKDKIFPYPGLEET